MTQSAPAYLDSPPASETITAYDREHMTLYLRLFDAARDGADWREVVRVLFGLDPAIDPVRCRSIHDSHLARAHWMAARGFRQLTGDDSQTKQQ